MEEFIKDREIYLGEEYRPWSITLATAYEECVVNPSDTIHAFWKKYPLFESTVLLFQLSIAAKGQSVPLQASNEKLQEFYDDVSKALIAFYFYSKAKPEQMVIVTRSE